MYGVDYTTGWLLSGAKTWQWGVESMMAAGPETTTLHFVRHAEVHNPGRVLYGRLARFSIGEAGWTQARAVAEYFRDLPIDAIYSSPLLRARQTASAIGAHHPGAARHVSMLLHEVGTSWQGTPFREFPPGFSTYSARRADGDESIEQVRERMERFVALARRRHAGQQVVCVSHGDPITILRVALAGQPLDVAALRGSNYAQLCSITRVEFRSGEELARVSCQAAPHAVVLGAAAGE